jgi:hypothetical protein
MPPMVYYTVNMTYFSGMNGAKHWKAILVAMVVIIILYIAASVFDIILGSVFSRFYSTAAFITIFGVAGVFAALLAYSYGMNLAPEKNEMARWVMIITNIITGALFFFLLAKTGGGEYASAFRSYGVTLSIASLLLVKGKVGI